MAKTPEIGERIALRMEALGYWKAGRPDVGRFCEDHGFVTSYLYRWLAGETPRGMRLFRLAAALAVAPEWLLTGTGPTKRRRLLPISGGSDQTQPLPVAQVGVRMRLIGESLSGWWSRRAWRLQHLGV